MRSVNVSPICFLLSLCERFDEFRDSDEVHNVYKTPLRQRTLQPVEAISENGHGAGSRHGLELTRPAASASESVVNLAIAPLVSREGKRIGRLIIFDDITDRDELERKLVQADKLSSIGLLAAGVAHEVNTPLAVISTYAQMLSKQVSDDDQKSKLLEKIAKQTFRASEIVNSLLNFSRTSPTEYVEVDSEPDHSRNCLAHRSSVPEDGRRSDPEPSQTICLPYAATRENCSRYF